MNLTKSYETFMLLLVGMKSTRTTLQNNEKDCKLNEAFFFMYDDMYRTDILAPANIKEKRHVRKSV